MEERGDKSTQLQKVQTILERGVGCLVYSLGNQESNLVSVLTRRRYSDSSRPVKVKVSQLECEDLHVGRRQIHLVENDVVVGGSGCSLSNALIHHKEIILLRISASAVYDCPWKGIVHTSSRVIEDAGVNPLLHNHKGEFDGRILVEKDLLKLMNFVFEDLFELALSDSIAIYNDLRWIGAIDGLEVVHCVFEALREFVDDLLAYLLELDCAEILGKLSVGCSGKSNNRALASALVALSVVTHINANDHRLGEDWGNLDVPGFSSQLAVDLLDDLGDNVFHLAGVLNLAASNSQRSGPNALRSDAKLVATHLLNPGVGLISFHAEHAQDKRRILPVLENSTLEFIWTVFSNLHFN